MEDRYKGMNMFICKHGHVKYSPKHLSPNICNLCGTTTFTQERKDKTMAKKPVVEKCSFCGALPEEVEKLFDSGNKAMICDECVMNCLNIMVYGEQTFEIDLGEMEEGESDDISNEGC